VRIVNAAFAESRWSVRTRGYHRQKPARDAGLRGTAVSRRPIGLLVIVVVVAACGGPASTVSPTATPTIAPSPTNAASPVPTAAPTTAAAGACVASQLAARVTGWDSGAGSRFAEVEITNSGSAPCSMPALDEVQLVDGHGSVLIDGETPAASATVTLAAGAMLKTDVQASNYCGADPAAPVTVAFVLPGGSTRFVATPFSATDTTGVPPCLGAGGPGSVTMTAWAS